jgi:hypothetical protein
MIMRCGLSRYSTRRRLLALATLWPWMAGCAPEPGGTGPHDRFKGIGCVLVIDAIPGAEMEGVAFYDDTGMKFYSKSLVSKRTREILALGGSRVPVTVRAIWRRDAVAVLGGPYGLDYEGTIIGDHTISVAERIPQQVIDDIRARGGALRLKFRLKPDGVLFGWDIERDGGGFSRFDLPGGDFGVAVPAVPVSK